MPNGLLIGVAGSISSTITNSGTRVTEFYVYGSDKQRIVGEKENITPGQSVTYVAQLEPRSYYTACKVELTGSRSDVAEFTVTDGGRYRLISRAGAAVQGRYGDRSSR